MTDPDGNVSSASNEHLMICSPHQQSEGNAYGLLLCGKDYVSCIGVDMLIWSFTGNKMGSHSKTT